MQAPCSTARSLTTSRASGIAIRCARVVLAVVGSVTGHLRPASVAGPGVGPAAQAALSPRRGGAVIEQDQAGGADRARLIGPPGGHGAHAASGHSAWLGQARGGQRADVGIRDPSGADPHRIRVSLQPDERHPGAGRRVRGDQLAGRAAVPGAVAEHHVHLLGFIEPHRDPVREQVPDGQHVLARVLQRGHHAVADRPALGGQGGQRGHDPVLEVAVGLVGGQERDLIDQHHGERVLAGRGVVALPSGEPGSAVLHVGDRLVEHGGDGGRVGGVVAVGLEDDPAVGQFHQLRVSGQHPDQAALASAGTWPGPGPTAARPSPPRSRPRSGRGCRAAGPARAARPPGGRPAAP